MPVTVILKTHFFIITLGDHYLNRKDDKTSSTIKMVVNAMNVLDLLLTANDRMGVNQIAQMCEISPATTFRILKSMEQNGWIFQFSDGKYSLGEKVKFRTEKESFYLALRDVASIIMPVYSERYSQNMNLVVRKGFRCSIIEQTRMNRLIDYLVPVGTQVPYNASAGGKVLLSELPSELTDTIISSVPMIPFTSRTITDPDLFREELAKVKEQGYALDNLESFTGAGCIAVPVRDNKNTIVAALSFTGITCFDDPEFIEKFLPPLQEASSEINRLLYKSWGNTPGPVNLPE